MIGNRVSRTYVSALRTFLIFIYIMIYSTHKIAFRCQPFFENKSLLPNRSMERTVFYIVWTNRPMILQEYPTEKLLEKLLN